MTDTPAPQRPPEAPTLLHDLICVLREVPARGVGRYIDLADIASAILAAGYRRAPSDASGLVESLAAERAAREKLEAQVWYTAGTTWRQQAEHNLQRAEAAELAAAAAYQETMTARAEAEKLNAKLAGIYDTIALAGTLDEMHDRCCKAEAKASALVEALRELATKWEAKATKLGRFMGGVDHSSDTAAAEYSALVSCSNELRAALAQHGAGEKATPLQPIRFECVHGGMELLKQAIPAWDRQTVAQPQPAAVTPFEALARAYRDYAIEGMTTPVAWEAMTESDREHYRNVIRRKILTKPAAVTEAIIIALQRICDFEPEHVQLTAEEIDDMKACAACAACQERKWPPSGLCDRHYSVISRNSSINEGRRHAMGWELKGIAREALAGMGKQTGGAI